LPLEFKAERDEDGNPTLSEGQRVMLRAGFAKLRKLETDFATDRPEPPPQDAGGVRGHHGVALVAQFLQRWKG
jgi:type III restriction enzyme